MSRRLPTLALFAALAGLGASGCALDDEPSAPPGQTPARVTRVVDGDTLDVRLRSGDEKRVRLIGIDTPETKAPGEPVRCGGPEAARHLQHLAAGEPVTLTFDRTQDRDDRYGRLLAYVTLSGGDGSDLQTAQLAAGWARVYVHAGEPFSRVDRFRDVQASARDGRRGIWSLCDGDFERPR